MIRAVLFSSCLSQMIASEINKLRQKRSLLFVNKKKQKNFVDLGFSCPRLPMVGAEPFEQKFFTSFFQKRCFLTFLQNFDFTCYHSGQTLDGGYGARAGAGRAQPLFTSQKFGWLA